MNGGSNFTNKAQDAIMTSQQMAQERGQQQIDALHLLLALLLQDNSIVITILQKLGADIDNLKRKADSQIMKIPVVPAPQAFGQLYLSQDMSKVLDRARQESIKMSDEFISVEHLFLALLDTKSTAKDLLDKVQFLANGSFSADNLKTGKL
ncbi:MAG TPA: Clp protease N-terminal domain-containing protein, partial [Candidatus Staskawiczbacteria bacterium]|nr:Clp protease N-terminal domain-containing protein [Candidatus Staskawiczbacteria bacterium]